MVLEVERTDRRTWKQWEKELEVLRKLNTPLRVGPPLPVPPRPPKLLDFASAEKRVKARHLLEPPDHHFFEPMYKHPNLRPNDSVAVPLTPATPDGASGVEGAEESEEGEEGEPEKAEAPLRSRVVADKMAARTVDPYGELKYRFKASPINPPNN